jgi:1-pyrroline-5-carboxylate dehydrogenase
METELFGPVMTIFVYEDAKWEETLELVDYYFRICINRELFSVKIVMQLK